MIHKVELSILNTNGKAVPIDLFKGMTSGKKIDSRMPEGVYVIGLSINGEPCSYDFFLNYIDFEVVFLQEVKHTISKKMDLPINEQQDKIRSTNPTAIRAEVDKATFKCKFILPAKKYLNVSLTMWSVNFIQTSSEIRVAPKLLETLRALKNGRSKLLGLRQVSTQSVKKFESVQFTCMPIRFKLCMVGLLRINPANHEYYFTEIGEQLRVAK